MNEEYTLEEIISVLSETKKVLKYVSQNYEFWDNSVQECDKAFGDLRHYCEMHYPTDRKGKTKIVKLMRDNSLERRKYKDLVESLEPLAKSQFLETKCLNELSRIINNMQAKVNREREYRPRVLFDLFEEQ